MCAWDKSYHSLAYPKVIIGPQDMPSDEKSFYNGLVDALKDKIEVDDLVVEQHNGDYRPLSLAWVILSYNCPKERRFRCLGTNTSQLVLAFI